MAQMIRILRMAILQFPNVGQNTAAHPGNVPADPLEQISRNMHESLPNSCALTEHLPILFQIARTNYTNTALIAFILSSFLLKCNHFIIIFFTNNKICIKLVDKFLSL